MRPELFMLIDDQHFCTFCSALRAPHIFDSKTESDSAGRRAFAVSPTFSQAFFVTHHDEVVDVHDRQCCPSLLNNGFWEVLTTLAGIRFPETLQVICFTCHPR